MRCLLLLFRDKKSNGCVSLGQTPLRSLSSQGYSLSGGSALLEPSVIRALSHDALLLVYPGCKRSIILGMETQIPTSHTNLGVNR